MADELQWTEEAKEKLKEIPFFVRGVAKKKIEKRAFELGTNKIDISFMEKVRAENKKTKNS